MRRLKFPQDVGSGNNDFHSVALEAARELGSVELDGMRAIIRLSSGIP